MNTRFLLPLLLVLSPLFAQDDPLEMDYQQDYDLYVLEELEEVQTGRQFLTGDWGGSRTYLHQNGLDFLISYVTDMLGNPHGGMARGFAYAGSFGLSVYLDFDKALKKSTGLSFYSSATWRTGTNLSTRKIGNEFAVSQLYGYETILLGELYLKESLADRRLIVKAGRLTAGNDFLSSPLYALFVENAFDGNPVGIFYNFHSFTAYPVATWGAYLAAKPIPQLLIKAAAFNANVNILRNKYHGCNFTFASTNGVIWITEWNFLLNQEKNTSNWPGNYKAGFLYQTGDTLDFQKGIVHGNYCGYLLIDQVIYQKGPRRLTPFAAFLFAPSTRNQFPFFLSSGLVCEALFQSRPDDTTNIGLAYGKYSFYLAPQTYEMILELNHWFQINNWTTFTPDLQYIIRPKGSRTIPNALVIGFQMGFIL